MLLCALFGRTGFAQQISGEVVGTVIDSSSASVGDADITLRNTDTGVETKTKTNESGQYRIANLLVGTYDLNVAASGFASAQVKGLSLRLNKISTQNVTLEVASASTTVDVTEAGATIDTSTAQIQNSFDSKLAQDLPTASVGSGVLNASLLGAGVTSSGGTGAGDGPSVGGQRPRNNNFTIEGVDNNSKSVTGFQVTVPNDAVEEFVVLQNQFQAAYGHSSGGQFNTIVRSGTNQFHGMLYDYFQNRNLNALDQAFKNQGITDQPRFDQNRLGGNIGGRIIPNKLFFFANFEYNPTGQASTTGNPVYGPTPDGYAALAGIPGVSATNLGVLRQYVNAPTAATGPEVPTLSVGGTNIPLGVVPTVGPNFQNAYNGVLSSDYNISDRDQIRGRYVYNKLDTTDTTANLPAFYTGVPTRNYLATVAWYHTFSPSITNEFRLGYNRQNQSFPIGNQTFPGLDQFPNLYFTDLGLQVGPNPNYPQFNINNLYQGVDNFSWTAGKHSLRFGTEFRKYIAPSRFVQRSRGDYNYNSVATYLLDQTPDVLAERSTGNTNYYGDQIATYSYAQDTWRVSRNLTLDLGLRYEYTTVPYSVRLQDVNAVSNVPGLLTFQRPTAPKTNFMPRIGVAFTPTSDQKTVIRAGFSTAYDVLFDNLGTLSLPPQFSTTVNTDASTPTPPGGYLGNGGISPNASSGPLSPAEARASTSAYIPTQRPPYSINWNFGIQHVFGQNYTVEARYVGTRGVRLPAQIRLNAISPTAQTGRYLPTYFTPPSAATLGALPYTLDDLSTGARDPLYSAAGFQNYITSYQPWSDSSYHGLALQINRRFSNGLQFLGSYTWSHAIDNATAEVYSTEVSPRRAQDFRNLSAERSSSLLDRRHRLTVSAIYDVPFFKGSQSWLLKNLVGNWEAVPVYTYESPQYYTAQSALDSNLNGDAAGDRTVLNQNGMSGTGSDVYGVNRAGSRTTDSADTVAYIAANPNAQYAVAGLGAQATAGRMTLPTRPINNWDLSLVKRFNFTERFKFEIAAQAQNVFNHAQFIPGSINDVGAVSTVGLAPYTNPDSPSFNNPERIFSSNPRVVTLFAKIRW